MLKLVALKTGSDQDKPQAMNSDDAHRVIATVESNPFATLPELQKELRNNLVTVSQSTICRRLRARGLNSYRPLKFPLLTERHKVDRLEWTRQHLSWSVDQWRQVVFSDESRFSLRWIDGRIEYGGFEERD